MRLRSFTSLAVALLAVATLLLGACQAVAPAAPADTAAPAADAAAAQEPVKLTFWNNWDNVNMEVMNEIVAMFNAEHPNIQVESVFQPYADMMTPEGLRDIAQYARGIGVHKNLVLPRGEGDRLQPATSLVRDAHAAGLLVHVFTLRAENQFLPAELRKGEDLAARGDYAAEAALFLKAGIDGFFTDFPALGVKVRDAYLAR